MTLALIKEYRNLLDLSRSLCQAVESKDWSHAVQIEQRRQDIIRMMDRLSADALADEERMEISGLIREILELDAVAKPLLQNEMSELQLSISSTMNERKLGASYL